jgi:hypothetical protein
MNGEYLFPVRQTRRDFLQTLSASSVGLMLGSSISSARAETKPVTIGEGKQTFTLDADWGKLPEGAKHGYGCAVVVDSQDRVYVTSRSNTQCVTIFDKTGKLVETWGKTFATGVGFENTDQVAATAHGLYWSKEGNEEFLYWTENVAGDGKKGPRIGARVYKTDLKGKVLHTLGNVEKEDANTQKFDFTNPTDVAVAPNGDIYIVDGYGSQKVHRFDKNFKLIKTIGGRGKDHGLFNTCHGVWISTLNKDPEVYIADRANNRVEIYSLDLEYKRTIEGIRNPCCFYQHEGFLYIPELAQRVTIIDGKDKIVSQMGDGKGIAAGEIEKHPDKFATPHALTLTSNGDLFVIEWLPYARCRKFKKTPV